MKFRFTYTVEHTIPESAYPEGSDPLQIEIDNAIDIIDMDLNEGKGEIKVEQIEDDRVGGDGS